MPRKNIRDILGLKEGESLVREDFNEKEFEKRMKKVAEYQKICKERKRVDWNKLSKFRPSPNPDFGLEFYNNRPEKIQLIFQNITKYFNNIRDYFSKINKYEND